MAFVSVIIPTFQSATTILDALTSVFDQTIKDVEILIVDDGSTDNLREVLHPFMDRITFLSQENRGSAAARNLGIKHSTGDIVAFLDADDIWLPEKLVLQLPLFEKNAGVGLVFGNMNYLNGERILPMTYFDLLPAVRGKVFKDLFANNFVPTSTTIVRRQALQQVGLFDESLRIVQDYHLWLRISSRWDLDYVPTPVTIYRIGSQQITRNLVNAATMLLQVKEDIYNSHYELLEGVDKNILERGLFNKYLRLAICYLRGTRKEEASQVLDRYYRARGVTLVYLLFRALLILPSKIIVKIIQLWDKFHQKPEYGVY